nr:MAG: hypothetical protein [Gammatorquevirus sp.]
MQNISAKDFFIETPYNQDTKNQIWMSQIADSHDNICDCKHPFAHLLASIFPPGHKDRVLSINQILARDYTEKCLSGGDAERRDGGENSGGAAASTNIKAEEEKDFSEEEIEKLLAAAAEENTR